MNMMRESPKAMRLGTKAYLKLSSGRNQDQVRFPRAKAILPKKRIWWILEVMTSGPGTGRWQRLKREYFSIQYMRKRLMMAKRGMTG